MTSLQNLQTKAREMFFSNEDNGKYTDAWAFVIGASLDEITACIYTAALQEALGKVFEVDAAFKDQMKIVRAIWSLLPKNEV